MPWKETSAESDDVLRRAVEERLQAGYEAHGRDGLRDRSRAPHRHANATPRDVAERIVGETRPSLVGPQEACGLAAFRRT